MNAVQGIKADERTVTILRANTWGFNFVVFALLIDIMFRSVVYHEAPWDLFALLGISGVISMAYAARHNVLMLNRKSVILMVLAALIAAVVAFILAMTKAM